MVLFEYAYYVSKILPFDNGKNHLDLSSPTFPVNSGDPVIV